jgi:hypothetical protein
MIYIGIDPGWKDDLGAAAAIGVTEEGISLVAISGTETILHRKGWLESLLWVDPMAIIMIEITNNYMDGQWEAVLQISLSNRSPHLRITKEQWMALVQSGTFSKKDQIEGALRQFPSSDPPMMDITEETVRAVLIAEYCYQINKDKRK